MAVINDIYTNPMYGKLYEKIENGESILFKYDCKFGVINHVFIKREIPANKNYFDIITPYGYGGPVIIEYIEGKKSELIKGYFSEFKQYCEDNNIVSEFVRFHPIYKNAQDFMKYYNVSHIRNTIGTNLVDFDNPFQSEFSKSCRKNIKKAFEKGVTFEIIEKPTDLDDFKRIYYSTMNRNEADEYYYFDDQYFDKCLELFSENIILVKANYEKMTIAMGFNFISDKTIHIHLSGTLSEFLYLSPAYVLRHAITIWGKERGYNLIHHGGGRSNSSEDNLYLFKKQFGKNTEFEFCIGKKIWNKDVYAELCNNTKIDRNIDFFPAYRSKR